MFSPHKHLFLCAFLYVINSTSCSEPMLPPTLVLYSPGDPEYTDVVVRRVHDNLTLMCELRGDAVHRGHVWNHVGENGTVGTGDRLYTIEQIGTAKSKLVKTDLQLSDSGHYMCSAPPFSQTKYILVQSRGPVQCARSAFWCGTRCVLASYVCDGRKDCLYGEDEDHTLCEPRVCERADKLNCSSGRCISAAACCRAAEPLCRQPACCDEHLPPATLQGYVDVEYPPLFEDRHAPDDYGFIQSTIYTVTACALIFMIAVVLLVSAICKMQMKRAALRGYTHADRARRHYSLTYHQTHRFPPCYEASRLLEQDGRPISPPCEPAGSPTSEVPSVTSAPESPRGLARLSAIFSSRYRQVPTQPTEVELTSVPASPTGLPSPLPYASPYDLEFTFADPETAEAGRGLNYMATPVEFYRRRLGRRNTLERVMDQLDRQRLTLQLGRFQLSLPRWGRPRPGTPDVAADERDTYTLHGRSILLGARLQPAPPSYGEAVRYKLYGPPPEYLSRETLNQRSTEQADQEAATNVEMPPCYDDLNGRNNGNANRYETCDTDNAFCVVNIADNGDSDNESHLLDTASAVVTDNANGNYPVVAQISPGNVSLNNLNVETLSSIIDNLPAIDSDLNANESVINNDHLCDNVISSDIDNVSNNVCVNTVNVDNSSVTNNVIENGNVINSSVINNNV